MGLSGMTVLDLPDSGLKEMDPRDIEKVVTDEIERVRPDVVVSYPVHGISGFHDHLVMHAVAKRVCLQSKERNGYPKRLAFVALSEEQAARSRHFPLSGSTSAEIDCVVVADNIDLRKKDEALDCYVTFQETIDKSGVRDMAFKESYFEIYQEQHDPPLTDLFEGLE